MSTLKKKNPYYQYALLQRKIKDCTERYSEEWVREALEVHFSEELVASVMDKDYTAASQGTCQRMRSYLTVKERKQKHKKYDFA